MRTPVTAPASGRRSDGPAGEAVWAGPSSGVTRDAGTEPGARRWPTPGVTGVDDGVADGERSPTLVGPTRWRGACGCARAGPRWSRRRCVRSAMTASAIAVPRRRAAPAPKAAPDRKLISSMRA